MKLIMTVKKLSSAHYLKMLHTFSTKFHGSNREPNQTKSKLTVSSHDQDAGVSHRQHKASNKSCSRSHDIVSHYVYN